MELQNTIEFARQLDKEDELRSFRNEFIIPSYEDEKAIYFLGNSLGLQPKRTEKLMHQVLLQWANYGVEGFVRGEQPWLDYHQQLTKGLSEIVGALPHEVVVMNQLTVNLHLMLISFYQPEGKRKKIICEAKAFPSDQYMLHTHVQQRGFNPDEIIIEVQPRPGEVLIRSDDILQRIEENKDELALVFWGGVNYYTGQVFNMKLIAKATKQAGAKIGFDLAHAAGNVFLQLHEWEIDFACWCNYKYLNSGPGSVAAAYIHERHHKDPELNRFGGWWGNKKATRFLMKKNFEPEPCAQGWQLSTPSPILFAAHKASLEVFMEAGINKIFVKGQKLGDYLFFLLGSINKIHKGAAFQILTPADGNEKGCQVSMLMLMNGKKIFDYLSANGVYADWREPDVIRVAPVGLYNTFEEVWQFVHILNTAIKKYTE